MGTADEIIGQIPVVVAGGVALKFTQAALGKQKRRAQRSKGKGKRISNKYNPF